MWKIFLLQISTVVANPYKLSDTVNIISQYRCYSTEFMEFFIILEKEKKPLGEELLKCALRHPAAGRKGA